MPIRTNRGRAAVYRKLWGWPLRSPVHLVVTVLAIALIAAVVALISSNINRGGGSGQQAQRPGDQPAGALPVTAGPPATSGPLPTRQSGPIEVPTPSAASPRALHVARQWAEAWVHHPRGISNARWLAGLRPYTTAEFLPVMKSVDPANIPATKVTGSAKPLHSYTSSVEVRLPTNGGALDITVISTPAGWRVARYSGAGG